LFSSSTYLSIYIFPLQTQCLLATLLSRLTSPSIAPTDSQLKSNTAIITKQSSIPIILFINKHLRKFSVESVLATFFITSLVYHVFDSLSTLNAKLIQLFFG